jgi:DNA-binding NarL/FixJ family response regulator
MKAMRDAPRGKSATATGELVKILLIEDDPIVRECVESLVRKSAGALQLLVATTLEQGIELAVSNGDVGLALLGLEQLRARGARFAKQLHAAHEHIPVVALAATEAEPQVLQALDAGAMGFINKAASTRSLLRALRVVLDGGIHVPVSILKARGLYNCARDSARETAAARWLQPTANNPQALLARSVLQGRSNRAIARSLRISEESVRLEVSALLKTLAVTNRAEALLVLAALAASAKLLSYT